MYDSRRTSSSVLQRTSSDLRLNPHLYILFLDGVSRGLDASTVGFAALPRLTTREVVAAAEMGMQRSTGLTAPLSPQASCTIDQIGLRTPS